MTTSDLPTTPAADGTRAVASDRAVGIAAVLAATVFWSFGSVLGKAADLPGVVLGFWRMWIATVLMSIIVVATRRWPTWLDIRRSTLIGALFGFNICAFFITLEYVSIAVALIIGALTPVVALPIAVVFMGERLTGMKVGCALVAVAGVVAAVLTAPSTGGGEDTVVGYVWAVVSLFIWVAYLIAAKQVRRKVETVRLLWVISLTGALTVTVIALIIDADLAAMEGADWLWVTLLALGPGIVGHGLLAWAQPRVDSSVSSVLIQAEPVGASIAAWVFLGEEMSLAQALSMAVVVGALAVLAYSEARDDTVIVDEAIS